MEKTMHYSSVTVKRNTGLGPKPRLKIQLKPCTETQTPETPQEFSEVSSNVRTVEEISAKDGVKELVNEDAEGGEFDVERNEPEKEHESEEYEAREVYKPEQEDDRDSIKDDLHHDGKEFMHTTVLQDEDELEFEPEENNQFKEKDGEYDSGVEPMRDTVRRMEHFADEIEGYEDDDMFYNKTGRMINVDDDDECCHKVVNMSDKNSSNLELFVGGLDKNATEDDIKKVFSKVGEVVNIKLMKNRGFAFLQYATMEETIRALTELKNPVVNGKECHVGSSEENNTLFLENICRQWTEQRVIEKLKSFGVEELKDLRLARDISNERINRGFAYLEFSSHSDAMTAYKRLQKPDVVLGVDRSAKVCFAYPHVDLRDKIVPKVSRVFLDGVPPSWDYEDIRELVKKFGKIKKIELARYKPSAKRRDYGFLTFYSHDTAVACAEAINNAEFGKGHYKVRIKASLSQPFPKWEWKHQFCRNFHLVEEPGSGVLRYSRDIPSSASAISKHETMELKPNMESASYRHKRALGYRSHRPLPPPERSYKRKSPVSIYPKRSMKKHYAGQDDLAPRKRYDSSCGSRVGKSQERGYSFQRYGRFDDSCRDLSYSQTKRDWAYETYGNSSHSEAHAYDHIHSSYSGSKRRHSTLENVPLSYANSRHCGSRAHSSYKIYESDSQYSTVHENDSPYVDVYYNRPKRVHLGNVSSSSRTYSPSHGSDYSLPVQGRSYSSVFSRLG